MKYLFLLLWFVFSLQSYSQNSILIDGYFSDWNDVNTILIDAPDNNSLDLLSFQVTNDQDYLYIHLILNSEIQLMGDLFTQSIYLYLDTDNNSNTGFNPQSNYGTELGVNFKQHFAYYNVTPFSTVTLNSLGLIAAPTVSSNEFEIAIRRDAIPDGSNPLFPSNTIKILFQETIGGDNLPNDGDVFTYEFNNDNPSVFTPISLQKESSSFIRTMAFNTLFDGITDPNLQNEYERILQSIQPQVIGFSECVNSSASQVKSRLDEWLPSPDPNGWYVIKDDYDLVTASLWPFINSWPNLQRQFPTLIDLPSSYPKDLLFTNAHLKCCDGNDLRQLQVDEYAAFILDAKVPGGNISLEENTPIIYAGDLNLVGFGSQLTTLLTGEIQNTDLYDQGGFLDWDNTINKDLSPIHSDQFSSFTWQDESSEYTPSRIDYIIYADAVVHAEKSFVLNTREMSEERLQEYNLEYDDSFYASDHLPVVMDFSFVTNVAVSEKTTSNASIFPNPTDGQVVISNVPLNSSVAIFSLIGEEIMTIKINNSRQIIDLSLFDSGVYFIEVSTKNNTMTSTIIKK